MLAGRVFSIFHLQINLFTHLYLVTHILFLYILALRQSSVQTSLEGTQDISPSKAQSKLLRYRYEKLSFVDRYTNEGHSYHPLDGVEYHQQCNRFFDPSSANPLSFVGFPNLRLNLPLLRRLKPLLLQPATQPTDTLRVTEALMVGVIGLVGMA